MKVTHKLFLLPGLVKSINLSAKAENKKGQSLFELLVAVFITAVTLVTLLSLVGSSVSNSTLARDRSEAVRYTNEVTEWLRSERDANWTTFISRATASGRTYCLQNLLWSATGTCVPITGTKFTRELTLIYDAAADPNVVEARVVTTWSDSSGTHESRSTTKLTNWRTQ